MGTITKFNTSENWPFWLREFGEIPRNFATIDEALQVKELFTGGMVAKLATLGTMIPMLMPATAPWNT